MSKFFIPLLAAATSAVLCQCEDSTATKRTANTDTSAIKQSTVKKKDADKQRSKSQILAAVSSVDKAQLTRLYDVRESSLEHQLDTMLNFPVTEKMSPHCRYNINSMRALAALMSYFIQEDAVKRATFLNRYQEELPGLAICLLQLGEMLDANPADMMEFIKHLSPEQLERDSQLAVFKAAYLAQDATATPAEREQRMLACLKAFPTDSACLAALAVQHLYPEYGMVDIEAAKEYILRASQAKAVLQRERRPAVLGSILLSIADAAAQEEGVDTLPIQYVALSLARRVNKKDEVKAAYRMGMLYKENLSHPAFAGIEPRERAAEAFASAVQQQHPAALYELGTMLENEDLLELALQCGYKEGVDYTRVSPGRIAQYEHVAQQHPDFPDGSERELAWISVDVLMSAIEKTAAVLERRKGEANAVVQYFLAMSTDMFVRQPAYVDSLLATDEELLADEERSFKQFVESATKMKNYKLLYQAYKHGSSCTGRGKNPALAEKYLQEAAEQGDRGAIRLLAEGAESPVPQKAAEKKPFVSCVVELMSSGDSEEILQVDDGLKAWAAEHPAQEKLVEALRIQYLLWASETDFRVSSTTHAVARELRQRLLQLVQQAPADIADKKTVDMLREVMEYRNAVDDRELKLWQKVQGQSEQAP